MRESITFTLNGETVTVGPTRSTLSLLELLRPGLGSTGTPSGCVSRDCGCCNVQVDGTVVPACLVLAPTMDGRDVRTAPG